MIRLALRATLASVALQLATYLLMAALPRAAHDDRLATRAAAMQAIARSVGPVPGRGSWTVQPAGLARAALASAASVAVSGAAAYGTLALAVALVTP